MWPTFSVDDAGGEVDQAVPVDVLDDRARGAGRDDRVGGRDARRDRRLPTLAPLAGPRAGDLGDELALLGDVQLRLLLPQGMAAGPIRQPRVSLAQRRPCQAVTRPSRARRFVRVVHPWALPARRSGLFCTRSYNRRMALTVHDILGIPALSLRLVAGQASVERPIRWVHASELEDPTPWLKGGELLLTTGAGIGATPAKQRAYVRRLADAGLAGLGFGLGFGHERIPRALATAAEQAGFPLFEVPYPVPFIAITEAVFTRLLAEQYEMLQRAVEAEHVLTRAVMEGEGVEGIAASLARVTGGWALLLDLHGMPLAATSQAARQRAVRVWEELRTSRPEGVGFSLTIVDRGHHVWIQPVGAQGRVEAFLAVGKPEALTQTDRIVAGHALSLFAIELAKSRAVAEAERRLRGDFFDALTTGGLPPSEIQRGLARFGFERDAEVVVAVAEGG